MMYCEKLVACVKVGDKIIREQGENVYLPFGSDYSIYLKNLHTSICAVSITIDGEDVLSNHNILIDPKTSMELEGFLNDNGRAKNKFRFIEKTEQISEYRGDNIEDGLIVITYKFVEPRLTFSGLMDVRGSDSNFGGNNDPLSPYYHAPQWTCSAGDPTYGQVTTTCSTQYMVNCTPVNDLGITVKGQRTNQNFRESKIHHNYGEEKTMVLHLKGVTIKNEKIATVKSTRQKIKCPTCGLLNKSYSKYCNRCGTSIYPF